MFDWKQFFNIIDEDVSKVILEHLHDLEKTILRYFPKIIEKHSWVQNPFSVTAKPTGFSATD